MDNIDAFITTIVGIWNALGRSGKITYISIVLILVCGSIAITYLILTKVLHYTNEHGVERLRSVIKDLKSKISELEKENLLLKKQNKKLSEMKTKCALKDSDCKDEALDEFFV